MLLYLFKDLIKQIPDHIIQQGNIKLMHYLENKAHLNQHGTVQSFVFLCV